MLRKSEEMIVELRKEMRGGVGEIRIKNFFQNGDLKGKTRLMAEITIPVRGSIGFHEHDQEEEIFYFISGEGRVKDQDKWKQVRVGDALVTGGGTGHAVENTGDEPLVLMAVILVY